MGNTTSLSDNSNHDENRIRTKSKGSPKTSAAVLASIKGPATIVLKDQSIQTKKSNITNNSFISKIFPSISSSQPFNSINFFNVWKKRILNVLILYFLILLVTCYSEFIQGCLVYFNMGKIDYRIRDPHYHGLLGARNIEFKTEDNLLLKGFHLPPTSVLWNEDSTKQSFLYSSVPTSMSTTFKTIANHTTISALNESLSKSSVKDSFKYWNDEEYDKSLANANRIIIYFHGNGLNRIFFHRTNTIRYLSQALNAHVIIFDYRGFGDSEGWPTENGTLLDGKAVIKYVHDLIKKYRHKNNDDVLKDDPYVYVYGHSLGTGISIQLLNYLANTGSLIDYVDGLIIDSPFSTLMDAFRTHPIAAIYRIFPRIQKFLEKMFKFHYRSQDVIGNLKTPILLVHGEKDYKLPIDNSLRLLDSALKSGNYHLSSSIPEGFASCYMKGSKIYNDTSETFGQCMRPSYPIEFIAIPDRSHSTSYKHPLWLDSIQKFIKEVEARPHCCRNHEA